MAFSQYLADEILDWIKGGAFPAALSNVYVSVHSANPGTAGTSGDVTNTVNGSGRVTVSSAAFTAIASAVGGGREITNTGVILISSSSVNVSPVTISHFGIWDAATAGNFLASGSLTTPVEIQSGDTVQFNTGALAIRVV